MEANDLHDDEALAPEAALDPVDGDYDFDEEIADDDFDDDDDDDDDLLGGDDDD
jgi:hypothetical protein